MGAEQWNPNDQLPPKGDHSARRRTNVIVGVFAALIGTGLYFSLLEESKEDVTKEVTPSAPTIDTTRTIDKVKNAATYELK